MCKELIHTGDKRTQKNRKRKLYTQMNDNELQYLVRRLTDISSYKPCDHALSRLNDLRIDIDYIKHLGKMKTYNIIEYNTGTGRENRVVVKDYRVITTDKGNKANLLLVVDLDQKVIITAFINLVGDAHTTVDMRNYDKNLKII